MVYVTCSILPEEDEDRVAAFLERRDGFVVRRVFGPPQSPAATTPPPGEHLDREAVEGALAGQITSEGYLRLTPRSSGTDGFFVAVLERAR
jgi:16S rRNA (cytosine967-C5)-methyltransferase